ncbi:SPOR domain-containing protein [Thioalkalivibrio sp.]|uniref:SPOR domain-containing protein n=1 Tax=Thioalkalivibrio sp. TaxID=2093813 RepID=UPI0035672683
MTVEPPVRYRMVGAIVLIFLAVLFLPWLFDGAGYEAMQDVERPIPDRPVFVEPHTPPAPAPELRTEHVGEHGDDATSVVQLPEASPVEPVPGDRGRDAATAEATGPLVGWSVQVGSFGREANARDQVQRLREAGFTAFVERGTANGREVWRVKAGPRAERDAALRLRDDLQRRMDVTGIVVAHP